MRENEELNATENFLKRYLSFFTEEKEIVSRLADVYFRKGKIKEGIGLLDRVKERFNDPGIYNNLGVFWAIKKPNAGIPYFQKALEQVRDWNHVHSNRGAAISVLNLVTALLDIHQFQEAENLASQFLETAPNRYYLTDEALSRIPQTLVRALAMQGKIQQAVEAAEVVVSEPKTHIDARIDMACTLTSYHSYVTGDFSEAKKYAELAFQLVGDSGKIDRQRRNSAINNLAFVLIEMGYLEEAKSFLRKLQLGLLRDEYTCATMGLFALRNGHLEKGKELYRRAIAIARGREKKDLLRQLLNLEIGRYLTKRGERRRAVRFLKKALEVEDLKDLWPINEPRRMAVSLLLDIQKREH